MGLGILQSRTLSHVPGTEILDDHTSSAASDEYNPNVKRTKDGIILIPQPSDDPEDPLNWSIWRRDMITLLLSLTAVFSATLTSLLAADSVFFLTWFPGVNPTDVAMLTGWHILGIGIGGYCFVASARIWGKRHLYILGVLINIISCVWAGYSGKNYNSFVAARFFQGVGLAPYEALLNASVGELYFVHESGIRMALSNMSLFGATFLAPVIVGNMTAAIGWWWTFWLVAILLGAIFPAVFLLCPETAYVRKTTESPLDMPSETASPPRHGDSKDISTVDKFDSPASDESGRFDHYPQPGKAIVQPKLISGRSLRLFTGRKTDENFFKVLIRPLPLFFHPTVLWACLIQGSIIGWTTLLGVMLALLLITLGFNEVQTGNMYGGPTIGALVGFALCGLLSDWTARLLTRWNRGVYEPEFRLVLILPLLVFGAGGLYGFGITAAAPTTYGWLLPDVFFAWVCGGLVFGTVAPALYIVDAHRDLAVEAFTCMLLFKNVISWLLCYKGFVWLFAVGARDLFTIIASVEVAICALTVPLYVFGKKQRSLLARYDFLQTLRLR